MDTMKELRANRVVKDCMQVMWFEYDKLYNLVQDFKSGVIQAAKARKLYHKSMIRATWYNSIAERIKYAYPDAYTLAADQFDINITTFESYIRFFEL